MDYTNATNEELEQLVKQKDAEAICELAERCMNGTKGHPQNLTRAYQLFHKGEKMGLQKAYLGLATMYEHGIYFAKNINIANEYYQKAGGQPIPVQPAYQKAYEQPTPVQSTYQQVSEQQVSVQSATATSENRKRLENAEQSRQQGIDTSQIKVKIELAENARVQENFSLTRKECNEAIKMLDDIESGIVSSWGTDDLDVLRIDAYWVLAFAAFNEQKISDMEKYLAKDGVQALHPWGAYLAAVVHRNMQSPDIVLQQDLQALIMVSQNPNLSVEEKGDICLMIGDLILSGIGENFGHTINVAHEYFIEAANCGSQYAKEQLSKFEITTTGQMVFNGS